MGRFSHEASMLDPKTGYVYETEDATPFGLYKVVPYRRGRLNRGGKLYMLAITGKPGIDLGPFFPIGTKWDVNWVSSALDATLAPISRKTPRRAEASAASSRGPRAGP